jgi:glycosyltransferase involved in cell wall biosynthesis
MKPPLVSIIIPTYHAAGTLARTLESIRRQSYQPLEVIVVDGASPDRTVAIADEYRDIVSTLISEKDRGQAHAINKGFQIARGDILCWLCADDEFLPDTVELAVNLFNAAPDIDVITGACGRIFPDGTMQIVVPPPNVVELIGIQYRLEQPSTFWRRRVMENETTLDEGFHYAFDWDFFARIIRPPNQTLVLSAIMSVYHFSATNKTSTGGRKLVLELREVVRRHGPLNGRLAEVFYFLYRRFDLAGCYDHPPACTPETRRRFDRVMARLERKYPREFLQHYNWNFASRQERGLVWWYK